MAISNLKTTLDKFEQARLAYLKKHKWRYWKELPLTIGAIFAFFMIIFLISRYPAEPLSELAADALFASLAFSWLINFFVKGARLMSDQSRFGKVFQQMVLNNIFASGRFQLAFPQQGKINQTHLRNSRPGTITKSRWKSHASLALQGSYENKKILVSIFSEGETLGEQQENIYVEVPTRTRFRQVVRVFSKKSIESARKHRERWQKRDIKGNFVIPEKKLSYGEMYKVALPKEGLPFEAFCDEPVEVKIHFTEKLLDALKAYFEGNDDKYISLVISDQCLSSYDVRQRYMRKNYEGLFKLDAFLKEQITEETAERFEKEMVELEDTIEALVELEKAF